MYEKSKFSFTLCQMFQCKYDIHIPKVKTVVIVYITENKNKIDFEEIFFETNVFKSRVNFEN